MDDNSQVIKGLGWGDVGLGTPRTLRVVDESSIHIEPNLVLIPMAWELFP